MVGFPFLPPSLPSRLCCGIFFCNTPIAARGRLQERESRKAHWNPPGRPPQPAMTTPTEQMRKASVYGDRDPFNYDYDTVRTTGLVLAIVMFLLGIVIALSNKFKCKQTNANRSELDERQNATSAGGV